MMFEQMSDHADHLPSTKLNCLSVNHTNLIARELQKQPQLFGTIELENDGFNSPSKRITLERVIEILNQAIEKSCDPTLGLKIYLNAQLADFDALGFALSCSTNFFSILQRIQRFSNYILSNSCIELEEMEDGYFLSVSVPPHDDTQAQSEISDQNVAIFIEAMALAGHKIFGEIFQEKITPIEIHLPKPSHPRIIEEMTDFFGVTPITDSLLQGVKYSKATINKRLPSANPEMANISDEIITKQLQEIYQNDITHKVEITIREGLHSNMFSRKHIAETLGISESSLQKSLSLRNTSYSDILQKVRKSLALEYIRENKMRIEQIAFSLGFTNGSNFTRSFRSWTGYSPKEFKFL